MNRAQEQVISLVFEGQPPLEALRVLAGKHGGQQVCSKSVRDAALTAPPAVKFERTVRGLDSRSDGPEILPSDQELRRQTNINGQKAEPVTFVLPDSSQLYSLKAAVLSHPELGRSVWSMPHWELPAAKREQIRPL